ncbi:hypothetical protein [Desulfosporosinus sp. FKA]|uniref:hypothetical protein n=1 Tax=Desulfosporosinus sp. FKA TaxID=1969834 RepID=UPI000B49F88B|nr:hypothetical protein [Desulfosporosinus sp. FKA]
MKKTSMTTVLAATAIVATLAVTSTSVLAATAKTGNIQPTGHIVASATTSNQQEGNIEYAKKTLYNPDGSIAAIDETWANPANHNEKVSYHDLAKKIVAGAYVLENGNDYIKFSEDAQGKLTGYEMKSQNHNLTNSLTATKQDYINEYQQGTRRAGWKDEGLVQTAAGKSLHKLAREDKSTMPGEEGTVYSENVYLDPSSGLPVKGDISITKNGTTKLLYNYGYQFKNVSDNGTIFNTQGITIKKM